MQKFPEIIKIDGWFCCVEKFPNIDRTILDSDIFKLSARAFKIRDLHITDIQKIVGSFINPVYVQGVVDTKGSLIPFFIDRQKVRRLQDIIDMVQDQNHLCL